LNIQELAEAVGQTCRQIRYLIAEDIVPGAQGSRAQPDYGQVHIDALRRYQDMRRRDHKPSEIKVMLQAERIASVGGRFALAPGVMLVVDRALLEEDLRPGEVGDLAAAILRCLATNHHETETPDAA
jgi:hypothetical protein